MELGRLSLNKEQLLIALDVASEFVPFTDLASDIILLASVWASTTVIAPSEADTCEERALWYLALAFTVVGTLVDLVPEVLLLTEIALHSEVLRSKDAMRTLLRLIFSDGKPIIVFACSEDSEPPLHPSLVQIRDSLRRRLYCFAASLSLRDGCSCVGDHKPRWTYAGLLGILVGGELLTGIGASMFLRVEFGWAAVISLLASLFALLISTRCHMRSVGDCPLHECQDLEKAGHLWEFLIPGPTVLVRYLLLVPVWPLIVVYAEAVSVWPFDSAHRGDHSRPFSSDARWIAPSDWLEAEVPAFDRADNASGLGFLYWAIVPHLLWAVISATWVTVLGITRLVCLYLGYYGENWSGHPWAVYFASQESPFHVWSRHMQRALGLGFTVFMTTELRLLSLGFIVLVVVLWQAVQSGTCAYQEWAFAFSHLAWWGIMLIGHAARRRNVFRRVIKKPLPRIPGQICISKPLPPIPGENGETEEYLSASSSPDRMDLRGAAKC